MEQLVKKRGKFFYFLSAGGALAGVLKAGAAQAVCPVCTVAVGAGVGLSRWLGIDDTISGTWIGGLLVSLIGWTYAWLNKKERRSFWLRAVVALGWYALVLVPLYWQEIIGHELNKLAGVDRLTLGIAAGSVVFGLASWVHLELKKRHDNKSYFPFQKVVLPVTALAVSSLIFYFITK